MAFQGLEPAKDRERLLRMVGLNFLDEATLLGALLDTSAMLKTEGTMESPSQQGSRGPAGAAPAEKYQNRKSANRSGRR